LLKIKAFKKNKHRHLDDIPSMSADGWHYASLHVTSCFFKHNADFGQKDHLWMHTNYVAS